MSAIFKSKNSGIFLFIVILTTAVFIAIVCSVINDRNNKIINGDTLYETESYNVEEIGFADNVDLPVIKNEEEITETTTTSEKILPVIAKPGTLDDPTVIEIDEDTFHLTYINKNYKLPENYKPKLVAVAGSTQKLEKTAAKYYEKMYNAAKKDGVLLTPCSGYRSLERQKRNFNNKVEYYENLGYSENEAKEKTATVILPPGSSEHNLGLAMDIVCTDEWFEDTAEFKWLKKNAHKYGFILRYPKKRQEDTGIIYEPWHWRFVGVEAATEIKEKNLILEDYLGVNQDV